MATVLDVQNALAALIGGILYPNGTTQASAVGEPCLIRPGRPTTDQIDQLLKDGTVYVSIADGGLGANTSRYLPEWQPLSMTPTTISVAVAGTQATLAGTVATPQNVALVVNGKGYSYGVQPGDTLATIATALAALVNADTPASASGPVITIPSAHGLVARVGSVGTSIKEVGRVNAKFEVGIWAPTWQLRDAVIRALEPAMFDTPRITLADGSGARLVWAPGAPAQQDNTKTQLYWQNLFWMVEYAQTVTRTDTQILVITENVAGGFDLNGPPIGSYTA